MRSERLLRRGELLLSLAVLIMTMLFLGFWLPLFAYVWHYWFG